MLKHIDSFNKLRNKLLLYCLALVNGVLTIAYIIEFIKGNRTFSYLLIFLVVLWGFYVLAGVAKKSKKYEKYVPWILALGFIDMYAFVMFTTIADLTWIYLFVFSCLLPLYADNMKVLGTTAISFLIINFADVIMNWETHTATSGNIVNLEQRLACIFLCEVFIFVVGYIIHQYAKVVTYIYNKEVLDMLTGFHGYGYVDAKIRPRIERNHDTPFTLIYVDVDNFKDYNSLYGRAFGDKILKYLADIIRQQTLDEQANASLCRFDGDKFFIFIMNRTFDEVEEYYNGIKSAINNIITRYKETEVFVSATVVVTDTRFCPHSYEGLYMRALQLQTKARENGKNNLIVDSIEV